MHSVKRNNTKTKNNLLVILSLLGNAPCQPILIFSETYHQIIPTFSEFISNHTDIFRELLPNNGKHFFQSSYQIILTLSEN